MRLTVAQALVRFLSVQYSERDGVEQRLIAGCFGIFGHGNVAGVGQALSRSRRRCPSTTPATSRRMVHTAVAYARHEEPPPDARVHQSSIGPGATNMVTGAALATINRLPVLLLPGDVFATRAPGTVLQELEDPTCLRRHGQRHAAAGLEVLGPGRAARAARPGAARGDARADRPRRDRRGHARAAAGRAGRGVRVARRAVREARLARPPAAPRAGGARARPPRCCAARRKPLIVVRRRDDLRRGDRRAARVRRGHRDRRRRDPGRQGLAALRPPAGAGRDRRHRHHRRQRRSPARPT